MEIKKAFNNNIVLMQNNEGQEMVVMDRGLAFQKKRVKQSDKVEKTLNCPVSTNEKVYLTIHIHRVTSRQELNRQG
ncbi:CAT RNA binding domain-containing protein [Domibacillus tundrae]|uniref:CAT RNA binding domain-containing protein n=1 Tax=Domibacillus tundrae TaxID=1587527 RepID=UPI0012DFFD01|nr:CAT RNA binding domain-containing protein [Domibacillus tundrae]